MGLLLSQMSQSYKQFQQIFEKKGFGCLHSVLHILETVRHHVSAIIHSSAHSRPSAAPKPLASSLMLDRSQGREGAASLKTSPFLCFQRCRRISRRKLREICRTRHSISSLVCVCVCRKTLGMCPFFSVEGICWASFSKLINEADHVVKSQLKIHRSHLNAHFVKSPSNSSFITSHLNHIFKLNTPNLLCFPRF